MREVVNISHQPNQNISLVGGAWARLLQESGRDLNAIATPLYLTDDVHLLGRGTNSKTAEVDVIAEVVLPRQRDIGPSTNAEQTEERDTIGAMNTRAGPFTTATIIVENSSARLSTPGPERAGVKVALAVGQVGELPRSTMQ